MNVGFQLHFESLVASKAHETVFRFLHFFVLPTCLFVIILAPEPDHSLSFPFHRQIPKEGMNCLPFVRFCHHPVRLSWVGSSQE